VTFDPFGDYETRGYLRNFDGEKDLDAVRRLEHTAFETGLEDAIRYLQNVGDITYADVLQTHRTLFDAVYPWAGRDRAQTAPYLAVSKGGVLFAHPGHTQRAVEYALERGNNPIVMAEKPGDVFGNLAYAHPFLDGNGRTIVVVHAVLANRAGISIDWSATKKTALLNALTTEIDEPGRGHLDTYLKPFVRGAVNGRDLATEVLKAQGLDGGRRDANEILGKIDEPVVREKYRQQEIEREQSRSGIRGS
jgi:cell filamentation protein